MSDPGKRMVSRSKRDERGNVDPEKPNDAVAKGIIERIRRGKGAEVKKSDEGAQILHDAGLDVGNLEVPDWQD